MASSMRDAILLQELLLGLCGGGQPVPGPTFETHRAASRPKSQLLATESGNKRNGLANVYNAAAEAGLELLGQIFHHKDQATQPGGRRQLTSTHEVGAFLMCFGAPPARRFLAKTTPKPQ